MKVFGKRNVVRGIAQRSQKLAQHLIGTSRRTDGLNQPADTG